MEYVFAKLYTKGHVRADRWYKLWRTILYGSLEDEKPFQSVRRLTEYAEGALSGNICEDIRAHLESCTPCGELERDLADLARLCRECDPPRLPEALKRRLLERIQGEPRGR